MKTKWTVYKEKKGKWNHYYFFDNEKGLYMISCIFDKNLKRNLDGFKKNNESYELTWKGKSR